MRDRWLTEFSGVWIVALTIGFLLPIRPAQAQADSSIDEFIEGLGSPEAHVREESAAAILKIGEPARVYLRLATQDPVPEVSNRAWTLLGQLPVYLPDDPPEVKACLFDYELDDPEIRGRRIERLGTLPIPEARRALVRIARDEPDRRLRWRAVAQFAACDDQAALAEIRELDLDAHDPAQLVLAAWAWRPADPGLARNLLRQAVEMDTGLGPYAAEVAMQVIPLLKSLGMTDEARKVFDAGYYPLRELAGPFADASSINSLALYCARCDERLPEGLDLALRAVAAEPNNPAFLDTLAEFHFRMGSPHEAVRIEERALELRPHDDLMKQRLEAFLAAVE